jgi:hypothetical protein
MTETDDVPDPIADNAPDPEEVGETVTEPGTHLTDVVAHTHDGRVICTECVSDDYAQLSRSDPRQIPYGGPVDRGTEWDCPGPVCDHCRRRITTVTVLHYDGVCQPRTCPQLETPTE